MSTADVLQVAIFKVADHAVHAWYLGSGRQAGVGQTPCGRSPEGPPLELIMVSLPGPLKENAWRVVFFLSALVVGLSLTWTTAVGRSPLWQLLFWYCLLYTSPSPRD